MSIKTLLGLSGLLLVWMFIIVNISAANSGDPKMIALSIDDRLVILLTAIRLITASAVSASASEPLYTIPRHILYSFTVQNTTNRPIKDAAFLAYAPVRQTATQQCVNIKTSHPYELVTDAAGNQILRFTFNKMPPFSTQIISIGADLQLSDRPNPYPMKTFQSFVHAMRYCESDEPDIVRLAQRLRAEKTITTAKKIYRWVSGNLAYSGYEKKVRGAAYALKNRKGDCTEFMYLFVALCRANNVPARCMGGYICTENRILKPKEYHNWAEFYDNGVWLIADPQKGVFMKNQSSYMATRIISDSVENPMGDYCRFRLSGNGLRAVMNR